MLRNEGKKRQIRWRLGAALLAVTALLGCGQSGSAETEADVQITEQALCSGVQLATDASGAVAIGTNVTLTASNASCSADEVAEYRFSYRRDNDETGYVELQPYGAASAAVWPTAGLPSGEYTMLVQARNVGSSTSQQSYATTGVSVGTVCSGATLSASPTSAAPGAPVTLTAGASCGGGTGEFRFWYRRSGDSKYTELRGWGPADASWDTAALPAGFYLLKVDARAAGNLSTSETSETLNFDLGESCGSLSFSASPGSAAMAGSVVTLDGSATCSGSAAPEFRFSYRLESGSTWMALSDWSSSGTFNWNTVGLAPSQYRLRIETRANDHAHSVQSSKVMDYTLSAASECTSVTLTPSPKSPQLVGTNIALTGVANCGVSGSPEYRFLMRAPGSASNVEVRGWSSTATFNWDTTSLGQGKYQLYVQARAAGFEGSAQASDNIAYTLGQACTVSSAAISPTGTQPSGTTYTATVAATCTFSGVHEARFSYRLGNSGPWTLFRNWGEPSTTLATTGFGTGSYEIFIEVRAAGNSVVESSRRVLFTLGEACPAGYEPNGAGGCSNLDDCTGDPCVNGICVDGVADFTCQCDAGWRGDLCDEPDSRFVQVAANGNHSCAIAATGYLYCWGMNDAGQLGDGTTVTRDTPAKVGFSSEWDSIALGSQFSCGILNGALYCWGYNSHGQLGDGTRETRTTPVQVGSDSDWASISLGAVHACGIRDGALYCWGLNGYMQLGVGSTKRYMTAPTRIGTDSDWTSVSAGYYNTCAVRSGELYCWGNNDEGQLGDGTTTGSNVPVRVGTASDWQSVGTGVLHACGLRGGALYCWGANYEGELGTGDTVNSTAPVQVGSASDWSDLAVGTYHACGTRSGSLYCWGWNEYGQLGIGTNTQAESPTQVGSASDWAGFSLAWNHSCGYRDDLLYCWGANFGGQLGNGDLGTDTNVPGDAVSVAP